MREMYIHKDRNKGVYIQKCRSRRVVYTQTDEVVHLQTKAEVRDLYIYKGRHRGVVHVQTDKGRRGMYMYKQTIAEGRHLYMYKERQK